MAVSGLFLKYILMPLIAVALVSILGFTKRKNEALSNKTLIVFILLFGLIMPLPGFFGFAGDTFSPWCYLIAQAIYLSLGIVFVEVYSVFFSKVETWKIFFQVMVIVLIMTLGGYLFAILFNIFSNDGGGYVALTCMFTFPIPVIFYYTIQAFRAIPFEVYEVWIYPKETQEISLEQHDFSRLMVIELEFSRKINDEERLKVKAKAPVEMIFGQWFQKFVDDYNVKFPDNHIEYLESGGNYFGWIFYTKKSFFHPRRMLDANKSIAANRIRENVIIISKRVIEHVEERFVSEV